MTAKYKYKTLRERVTVNTVSAAGITLFGVGLSAIFNPLAIGVAGVYAGYKVGQGGLMSVPSYRKWRLNRMIQKGYAEKLPETHEINHMAQEISAKMGRKKAPEIYTIDHRVVASIALPAGLRWLSKFDFMRNTLEEKAMPKVFGALPGANTILTTEQALNNNMTSEERKFIIAHEIGHLKADKASLNIYGRSMIKKMTSVLMLGTAVAMGLSLFGVALPVTAGMGALKALGALVALTIGTNVAMTYGTRIIERRADRNALYITRDLESAVGAMEELHEPSQKKRYPGWREALQTHPSYTRRIEALQKSFNTVSKYVPANDNAKQPVAQQQAKIQAGRKTGRQ